MHLRSSLLGLLLVPFFAVPACGGTTVGSGAGPGADAGAEAATAEAGADDPDAPLVPASKVDLLFVVDNSASMADKSSLLASSVGTLLRDLSRVGDLHVGVVASSLGALGGDVCPDQGDFNGFAHLRTSAAAPNGVLAYAGGDIDAFVASTESLVRDVGERGCGLEAQLETAYRFLVQPDPWKSVKLDANNQADLGGPGEIDTTVLVQRKAFLRPDSALVVVMLTDEDDSSADPLSIGGQGWAFMARNFPGSKVFRGDPRNGTTAPRGTSACTDPSRGPGHPDCTSCGFAALCNDADPACAKIKNDPNCQALGATPGAGESTDGYAGYYGPNDDHLNVRFHRMKERFGIDPQFPIARYVAGFTASRVPNRAGEHPTTVGPNGRRMISEYAGTPSCTNPIFAETLPGSPGDELCELGRGPRSRQLVLFAVLGGVPESLATSSPSWPAILGIDPDNYDATGLDSHMIPSTAPRPGLPPPSAVRGDNGPDPVHGREWDTQKNDLQFACTFALPATRTCSAQDPSCDCALDGRNPPLCGATIGEQTHGKAYPTIRPLRVARALGDRGIVGSICASGGYDATMKSLSTRLGPLLAR